MPKYIDRDAFIKRLENEADRSSDIINLLILNGIANIVRDENIAPAADVAEVVHSKWIKRNNERRCPICHYFYMTNGTTVYNFCPMCGTKMDGK